MNISVLSRVFHYIVGKNNIFEIIKMQSNNKFNIWLVKQCEQQNYLDNKVIQKSKLYIQQKSAKNNKMQ